MLPPDPTAHPSVAVQAPVRLDRELAQVSVRLRPALVTVAGVCDQHTTHVVAEAIALASQAAPVSLVQVDLCEVEMLFAGATRILERAVQTARSSGNEVALLVTRDCIAHRVLTSIRVLLGPQADRLPITVVPTGPGGMAAP